MMFSTFFRLSQGIIKILIGQNIDAYIKYIELYVC